MLYLELLVGTYFKEQVSCLILASLFVKSLWIRSVVRKNAKNRILHQIGPISGKMIHNGAMAFTCGRMELATKVSSKMPVQGTLGYPCGFV